MLRKIIRKKGECLYILNHNIKYYTKEFIKLSIIMTIGLFIILAAVLIKYKPMYNIKLGNTKIGYLEKLENFDNYIEEIKNNENIAFVELKEQPEFKMQLVNRNTKNSEEEIKKNIQNNLLIEYTSYAVTYKGQNVTYLSNMEIAEDVINQVQVDKESKDFGILQVYSDNYEEISAQETDEAIVKVSKAVKSQKKSKNTTKLAKNNKNKSNTDATLTQSNNASNSKTDKDKKEKSKTEKVNNKKENNKKQETENKDTNSKKENKKDDNNKEDKITTKTTSKEIIASLSKPLSGTITSRFGGRKSPGGIGSTNHKGLDIAAKRGTTIKAAASGTVKFAGYKGSLGNLVIIDHGNGIQTYYGHSSKIYVKKGQKVLAGEKIAAVGSTGAATGPHLHFEIHIKGKVVNPQNYLY